MAFHVRKYDSLVRSGAFIPIELAQEIGLSDADVERWKICVSGSLPSTIESSTESLVC